MTSEYQRVSIKHTEAHEESELTLPAGTPLNLTASNSNGELRIFAGDRPNVVVRTTRRSRAGDESFTRIEQVGNNIVVAVENVHWTNISDLGRSIVDLVKGERPVNSLGGSTIDVEIELPRESAAHPQNKSRFNTASGEIRVTGLSGKIDVNTASGEIEIDEGTVVLAANTASGEVTVSNFGGRVTARSSSGDIKVQQGRLENLTVNTASGDVDIEASMSGKETSTLHTVSGDLNVRLTAPAAKLTFSSVSGDADVHPPFERDGRGQWRLGPADAAGPTLAIKTVSGDLDVQGTVGEAPTLDMPLATAPTERIQTFPPAPPVPPVPPTPPPGPSNSIVTTGESIDQSMQTTEPVDQVVEAPDPEAEAKRMNVLQALERGEIDIEEAMSRLDAIDDQPAG